MSLCRRHVRDPARPFALIILTLTRPHQSSTSVSSSSTASAVPSGSVSPLGESVCAVREPSFYAPSCSITSDDKCCYTEQGHFLETFFWDTGASSTGPNDSWTVHGLWPDRCDGSYDSYCQPSMELTNITAVLQAAGQTDLLAYMDVFWKDYSGDDETFWEQCVAPVDPLLPASTSADPFCDRPSSLSASTSACHARFRPAAPPPALTKVLLRPSPASARQQQARHLHLVPLPGVLHQLLSAGRGRNLLQQGRVARQDAPFVRLARRGRHCPLADRHVHARGNLGRPRGQARRRRQRQLRQGRRP